MIVPRFVFFCYVGIIRGKRVGGLGAGVGFGSFGGSETDGLFLLLLHMQISLVCYSTYPERRKDMMEIAILGSNRYERVNLALEKL